MEKTKEAMEILKLSKSQIIKSILLLKTPSSVLRTLFPKKALADFVGNSMALNMIAGALCGQDPRKVTAAHFVELLRDDKSRGLAQWDEMVGPSQVR